MAVSPLQYTGACSTQPVLYGSNFCEGLLCTGSRVELLERVSHLGAACNEGKADKSIE